jgi:hypothetical protein
VDIVPDGAESVEPVSLAVGPKVGGNEGRSRLGGRCRLVPAHSSLGRQVRDGRDPRAPTAACDCPLSSLLRRLRSVRVRWVILVGSRSGGCQGVLANTGPGERLLLLADQQGHPRAASYLGSRRRTLQENLSDSAAAWPEEHCYGANTTLL